MRESASTRRLATNVLSRYIGCALDVHVLYRLLRNSIKMFDNIRVYEFVSDAKLVCTEAQAEREPGRILNHPTHLQRTRHIC